MEHLLLIVLAAAAVVGIVVLSARGDKPAAPARRDKTCVHGNSALAGGHIVGEEVRFYDPTPVRALQEALPQLEIVDCTQNGLTLREAFMGGPVGLGPKTLAQTQPTCEAIIDIWQREQPKWAYLALLEVDPLFDPQYDQARTVQRLRDLCVAAFTLNIRLIIQGPIHFAPIGPLNELAIGRLHALAAAARAVALEMRVPYVDLSGVPFDPAVDICDDQLHPTAQMHDLYTEARVSALRAILIQHSPNP